MREAGRDRADGPFPVHCIAATYPDPEPVVYPKVAARKLTIDEMIDILESAILDVCPDRSPGTDFSCYPGPRGDHVRVCDPHDTEIDRVPAGWLSEAASDRQARERLDVVAKQICAELQVREFL